MSFDEKPTDVLELEWRIGRLVKRCAEFLALCAGIVTLQAFLTIFNPANPVDASIKRPEVKKAVYLACVADWKDLLGVEWQRAMDGCGKKSEIFLYKRIDIPTR